MEENKYQRGKIYKIVDNGYNMCYYGSTVKLLCQRIGNHRSLFRKNKNKCEVSKLFDTYGLENCKIELVENYPCNSKEELLKREGFYIKNNDCINKIIAGRTPKEYREDHKDDIKKYREDNKENLKEQGKEYYKNHKDKKLEQNKKWREDHKDDLKKYREDNKDKKSEQNKKWREDHKEETKEYMKQYRLKKKEEIKEYIKQYRLKKKEEKNNLYKK